MTREQALEVRDAAEKQAWDDYYGTIDPLREQLAWEAWQNAVKPAQKTLGVALKQAKAAYEATIKEIENGSN